SLKLKPRAEALRFVILSPHSLEQAEEWTAALLAGPTRPAILDWLSPGPCEGTFSPWPQARVSWLLREFVLAPMSRGLGVAAASIPSRVSSLLLVIGFED